MQIDSHIDSYLKTLFCVHMSISTCVFSMSKSLTSQVTLCSLSKIVFTVPKRQEREGQTN